MKPLRSTMPILLLTLFGCVHADYLVSSWTLREDRTAAADAETTAANEQRPTPERVIQPGMSQPEVEALAGATNLDKQHDRRWLLLNQFTPFTPGFYPYFDSRVIHLYFDDERILAALIVRGEYNVYP